MADDPTHFLSGRNIIVAGAGFAGLSFVLSLFKFWDAAHVPRPEVLLVETDARQQLLDRNSYDLQLSADKLDAPLVGLSALGLLDAIMQRKVGAISPDAALQIWDKAWKPLMTARPTGHDNLPNWGFRVPREALLSLLIDAVEATPAKIAWQTSIHDVKRLDGGKVSVSLRGDAGASRQEMCDLLVAADGDESSVRAILRPDDVSKSTGYVAIGGVANFGDKASIPAPLSNDLGIIVGGDGVAAWVSPAKDGGCLVWRVFKAEKEKKKEQSTRTSRTAASSSSYDKTDAAAFQTLMDEARSAAANMAEPMATVIGKTEQATSFRRPQFDRDPFDHRGGGAGVVFIGEANRFVNSYGGGGAGLALLDGMDLARALVNETASLEAATTAYDKVALPRSTAALKSARGTMQTAHLSGLKWTIAKTGLAAGNMLIGDKKK